ncbi:MAG: serine hydrolase [Alphaproteobacteria bacterium]|nr:serine hydrolase [Alphaproteobacteria bacterium]
MRKLFAVIAAALVWSVTSAGAKAPTSLQELDQTLVSSFKDGKVPGATVAIVENGQVAMTRNYGVADLATKAPVTDETVFRAGSISKSFTSIAVMTLVEQGKLDLNGKLADLAPEVKFTNPWEQTDPVRLAHLLEHTTGWPDISTRILGLDGKGWSTLKGVQDASGDFVSRWQPGRFAVYNNAGPAVAGVIIEKASGKAFEDYMRDAVLRPMGMATADFDLPPDLAARIAKSYGADGSIAPYQYITLRPAGSLNTTVKELSQLVRFYLGRGTIDGRAILKPESVERIERSETNLGAPHGFTNGYGLGVAPFPDAGVTFRGHNGEIDAFTAVYGYNVRCNCGYVMMANGGDGVNFGTAASAAIQGYLTRAMQMQPPVVAQVPESELQGYAGLYRTITPPNNLLRPIVEMLTFTRVKAGDGKLVISGNDWFPTGGNTFRRADREEATLAFVPDGGSVYKISAFTTQVQEPIWRAGTLVAVAGILMLGLALSLIMTPVWLVSAVRGRLAERGGLIMRLLPLLSFLSFVTMMGLVAYAVLGSGTSAWTNLAYGPYSQTIFVASILFPLLALGGFVAAWRGSSANWFVRSYLGLTSLALLAVAAYLASIGWVGVETWAM